MSSVNLTSSRLVLALVAAGMVGGAGASFLMKERAVAAPTPTATTSAPQISGGGGLTGSAAVPMALPDFSQITERYGPAVVNISVTGMVKTALESPSQGRDDPFGNDPFSEFFRRFQQGQQGGRGMPREQPTHGEGSGFIISPDGLILTNAHVVRDAKEVTVKLTDRREFRAKVLGADPKTDVAVLRIDAHNLPVVAMGNINELKVGEWVLAIGSPYGFENTFTAGVVSAKGRSLPDDSAVPFIQTDVAVNPGNSGGPLFNTRGQVVGINSQIYSQTGGYQGLSFAIPIDVAMKMKDQIVAHGHVDHARLGVVVQEVNQQLADSFKLDKPAGALVASVEKGGPADRAGLQPGDVIRRLNGQEIIASGDLPAAIALEAPGDKIQMDIWRHGSAMTLSGNLGNASDKVADASSKADASQHGKLGLALRPLQPDEKQQAGVADGLVVQEVNGPAELAGVQPGDVLLAINGTPVRSVEQVRSAVAKSDKSVALLILRGDEKIFVPVRLG